ncbi:MAG: hypothetical protein SPK52_05135 [Synergistales bacterium]|nr:hypothetical protein [Bacteroidales bacterium]MDY6394044.1 hypothetical protein [Bacteroidales bacterium]MDY6424665.1 hypothetical protein [Bacteroidales bacterium]MDY6435582.1 hypothetical protein [Synergistales bacterium]
MNRLAGAVEVPVFYRNMVSSICLKRSEKYIHSLRLMDTEKFSISFLKNGTYIIRIKVNENKVHYQKLVKQ